MLLKIETMLLKIETMLLKIETMLLKIETMLLKIETRCIRKNVPPPSRTNHIPHVQFAVIKPGVGVGTLRFRVRFRVEDLAYGAALIPLPKC